MDKKDLDELMSRVDVALASLNALCGFLASSNVVNPVNEQLYMNCMNLYSFLTLYRLKIS